MIPMMRVFGIAAKSIAVMMTLVAPQKTWLRGPKVESCHVELNKIYQSSTQRTNRLTFKWSVNTTCLASFLSDHFLVVFTVLCYLFGTCFINVLNSLESIYIAFSASHEQPVFCL